MAKRRVFVSFDYDNDENLKDKMVGQAKKPDSLFEVIGHSLKESQSEKDWEEKTESAIKRAEFFIVMLGSRTRWASGVLKEVEIARKLEKRRFQIIGYEEGLESWAVPGGGKPSRWMWVHEPECANGWKRKFQETEDLQVDMGISQEFVEVEEGSL